MRVIRAAAIAHSADTLIRGLDQLAIGADGSTAIYIDALDEAMVPVKLAHNPEARAALRQQLFERYMQQLSAAEGVSVLVWMSAPNLARVY